VNYVTSWKELAIRMQLFSAMPCDYMTSQNVFIFSFQSIPQDPSL